MSRRDDEFSRDIDAMLHEGQRPESTDPEYDAMLDIAAQLQRADFSSDSQIRESLRTRLQQASQRKNNTMMNTGILDRRAIAMPSLSLIAAGAAIVFVAICIFSILNAPAQPEPETTFNGGAAPGEELTQPEQQNPSATPVHTATSVPTATPVGGSPSIITFGSTNLTSVIVDDCRFELNSSRQATGAVADGSNMIQTYNSPNAANTPLETIEAFQLFILGFASCGEAEDDYFAVVNLEDFQVHWVIASEISIFPASGITPTPIPTIPPFASECIGAVPTRLEIGMRGEVSGQAFAELNLRLRSAPSLFQSEILGTYPAGTAFTVIDGPTCTDGLYYFQVALDDGSIGWFTESFEGEYVLAELSE